MDGTGSGRDQQRASVVFVQHAVVRSRGQIADRIVREAGHFIPFGGLWQHLQQQRIARVAASHARHETTRNAQRKSRIYSGQKSRCVLRQIEHAQQLARIGDRIPPCVLPGAGIGDWGLGIWKSMQVGVSVANPNVWVLGQSLLLGFAALTPTYRAFVLCVSASLTMVVSGYHGRLEFDRLDRNLSF
jgi:hypothetical protein